MAIQFARCEYITRSKGGNACRVSARNGKFMMQCERTGEKFYYKKDDSYFYHKVLLPNNVDNKFLNASVLWNAVEFFETRKNSIVAKEMLLALPDDEEINNQDRIVLTEAFVKKYYTSEGLAVQIDIDKPKELNINWHAHLLITTRRFSNDGKSFYCKKARDLDPLVRKRFVLNNHLGERWKDFQNNYFLRKGIKLKVDGTSDKPREHLSRGMMRYFNSQSMELKK